MPHTVLPFDAPHVPSVVCAPLTPEPGTTVMTGSVAVVVVGGGVAQPFWQPLVRRQ